MFLRDHKTKIIATIGPASESPETLVGMIRAGLDIARLNFSHGDLAHHADMICRIRAAALEVGRPIAIMADLPGPKMRLGTFAEPIHLKVGDNFTLTSRDILGNAACASTTFDRLPRVVKRGDILFLNDGVVRLQVEHINDSDVCCKVVVGGDLSSRKGLNLPGLNLGIAAFTDHDRDCLEFALAQKVDAVSQSFVESAKDIESVRSAAAAYGKQPFIIAKIERSAAITNIDNILRAADGIMIARGDLGVEVPIQQIAILQKQLIARANAAGKPVITATQMLESMTQSRLPTRAESTDVANAVLDGTDCVMLSGESAVGKYPEEAVSMLASIAAVAEAHRGPILLNGKEHCVPTSTAEAIGIVVEHALRTAHCAAVFVPSRTGDTARMISRFKPATWIVAVTDDPGTAAALIFSYGVEPVLRSETSSDWRNFAAKWLSERNVSGNLAMLVAGSSPTQPDANHRIEFMRVGNGTREMA